MAGVDEKRLEQLDASLAAEILSAAK